jgi:hypothetical protein
MATAGCGTWVSALLAVGTFVALGGCGGIAVDPDTTLARAAGAIPWLDPIMELPAGTAVPALVRPHTWLRPDLSTQLTCPADVATAVAAHQFGADAPAGDVTLARFLHISDAQLRDERLHDEQEAAARLKDLDKWVSVTVRNSNVEYLDTLTLAAFLFGFAKNDACSARRDEPGAFVIHTGDLLDISVTTELLEGLEVFAYTQRGLRCPVYSVAGNHDGTTFGNLPDSATDTRGLGINRSEFVMGHLLTDGGGFGFAGNELVQLASVSDDDTRRQTLGSASQCLSTRAWPECLADQLEKIDENRTDWRARRYGSASPEPEPMDIIPADFSEAVDVSGWADTYGDQLGYYAFDASGAPSVGAIDGVRMIVLDTRSRNAASGDLSPVQLGWLYEELARAHSARRVAVVMGHHKPKDLPRAARHALEQMLTGFGNVVGYFYGHSHWNTFDRMGAPDGPLLVQTGSIADFPQVARDVRISAQPGGDASRAVVTVAWSFWRPKAHAWQPQASEPVNKRARLLHALLQASLSDARKEQEDSRWLIDRWRCDEGSPCAPVLGKPKKWIARNLPPGSAQRVVDFARPVPSPRAIFASSWGGIQTRREQLRRLGRLSEASGVAWAGHVAIIAGDETEDRLWTYDLATQQTGAEFLPGATEVEDLEALTRWDADTVLGSCSASPTKKGKERTARGCLMAARGLGGDVDVRTRYDWGPSLARRVEGALGPRMQFGDRTPGDINVEGIARHGRRLLIGLRSPTVSDGGAVVVPLMEPMDFLMGSAPPRFQAPLVVPALPGEGIRDLAPDGKDILVLLGPSGDGDGRFRILRWDPDSGRAAEMSVAGFDELTRPEGLTLIDRNRLLVVQDLESGEAGETVVTLEMADR